MRKKIEEEVVLLVTIVKWISLAAMTGMLVGCLTALFLYLLELGVVHYQWKYGWFIYFIPAALLLGVVINRRFAPGGGGHGTDKVIEAVHKRAGRMNWKIIPATLTATLATLIGGGSAGKEGPCALLGAGVGSCVSDCLRLEDRDRKKIVICGISAGFAAVFGTPVAGALFAVEVLVLGMLFQDVLLPSLVSSVIGYQTTRYLGQVYHFNEIHVPADFSSLLFLESAGVGLFLAAIGYLFIEMLKIGDTLSRRFARWWYLKPLVAGGILLLLAWASGPLYCGLGLRTIDAAVKGAEIPVLGFFWKMFATSVTMTGGGSGGLLTPISFIGSTAGSTYATVLGLDPAMFAGIGLVALLAGCTNTPIACTVMAIELFGPEISAYAAIACVVSYIAIGHRSVYSSQILGAAKSDSLMAPLMRSLDRVETVDVEPRMQRRLNSFERFYRYLRKRLNRHLK